MISTTFGYGERESIAGAYAKMYAPKRMNESCTCGKENCECNTTKKLPTKHKVPAKTGSKLGVRKVMPFDKRDPKPCCTNKVPVKKVDKAGIAKKEALVGGTKEVKHKVPAKTGSKLGVRKVMPFDKRDPKSSAAKYAPKVKKVAESVKHFCISDGDRTLCTNDVGESYFNKGGITGETRIYESRIDALKDIKKVSNRRKAKDKYKVRGCQKVGESIEFIHGGQPVNEGLFDFVGNVAKGVGNVVGGVAKGAGNLLQGNIAQAGKDVVGGIKGAGQNMVDTASSALNTVADVKNVAANALGAGSQALKGDFDAAKDNLKGIQSSALGAVSNGAREMNPAGTVGSAVASGASKAVDAAKNVGSAVGNTVASAGNVVGGALKGAGELAQGNVADAKNAVVQGASNAATNLSNAKDNAVAAVTGDNQQSQSTDATQVAQSGDNASKEAEKQRLQAQIDQLTAQLKALG